MAVQKLEDKNSLFQQQCGHRRAASLSTDLAVFSAFAQCTKSTETDSAADDSLIFWIFPPPTNYISASSRQSFENAPMPFLPLSHLETL